MNKSLKYILSLFILTMSYHYVNDLARKKSIESLVSETELHLNSTTSNYSFNMDDERQIAPFTKQLLEVSQLILNKSRQDIGHKTIGYISIAAAYQELNLPKNASSIIQKTLESNLRGKNDISYWSLYEIAEYHLKYGNDRDAIKLLDLAFNLIKEISDYEERDNLLVRVGDLFAMAGEDIKALECAKLIEDDFDRVTLYQYIVQEYIDRKKYEQVPIVIEKVRKTGWENLILEEVVKSYLEQEDFQRAFNAIEMMAQQQARVNALSEIAQKYLELDDRTKAVESLKEAKKIANRIKDNSSKSWSLQAISRVSQQIETLPESESLLSASVEEAQKIEDIALQGITFNSLAFKLASAGKYEEALELIETNNLFIPKFEKIRLLITIAKEYQESNQPKKAEQIINIAMASVAKVKGDGLSISHEDAQSFAWSDIADYALENKQYDLTAEILEQIKPLRSKVYLLIKISDAYIKENEIEKAKQILPQARAILSQLKDDRDLSNPMAIAYQYAQIGDYYSAIEAVKLIPSNIYQAQTLTAIALKYAKSTQAIDRATFSVLETLK